MRICPSEIFFLFVLVLRAVHSLLLRCFTRSCAGDNFELNVFSLPDPCSKHLDSFLPSFLVLQAICSSSFCLSSSFSSYPFKVVVLCKIFKPSFRAATFYSLRSCIFWHRFSPFFSSFPLPRRCFKFGPVWRGSEYIYCCGTLLISSIHPQPLCSSSPTQLSFDTSTFIHTLPTPPLSSILLPHPYFNMIRMPLGPSNAANKPTSTTAVQQLGPAPSQTAPARNNANATITLAMPMPTTGSHGGRRRLHPSTDGRIIGWLDSQRRAPLVMTR